MSVSVINTPLLIFEGPVRKESYDALAPVERC